jgi:hypothetical protein
MKRVSLFLFGLIVMGLIGCSTPQAPVPNAPRASSEKGKECIRQCQGIYAQCNGPCGKLYDNIYQRTCLDNCSTVLKECYATCE